ncbi:MAG TPA: murein biosynthesis integral membrane protein MurJ [Thermomicrobiales bacterium]|nr:murein biosynthesis integral membrane protein MurJ [Thermomicrobiales bacterium]
MDPLGDDIEVGSPGAFGEPPAPQGRSLAIVATVIFFGSMLGRLLGLAREQLAASRFGAGDQIAAFTVADNLNTLIFDLISSGMLEAALIPVLSALVVTHATGRNDLRRLTGSLLTLSVTIAALLAALGVVFAPALVRLMTALGDPGDRRGSATTDLAIQNLRIVLPSLVFLVAGTIMIAALYAVQRPGAPALGSAARNLSIVLGILLLGSRYGTRSMAVGVLIGAVVLAAMQWLSLRRAGLQPRFGFDTSSPELREIGRLYLPVFLGLIVSTIVVVIDRNLAWRAETDAVGAMRYATTLAQLILGLVVAAVSLAVLPQLAYQHASADEEAFRAKLVQALQLITVLLVPAVVGMAVLARPIVRLVFEHGQTGPEASQLIVAALLLYLPGHLLAGYDQVLIFAFYARKNTRLPVIVGVVASLGYLVVAFALFDRYQMRGLVAANTAQFALHTVLMLWFGRGILGRAGFVTVGAVVVRAGIASLAMGVVAWGAWQLADGRAGNGGVGELVEVIVPVAAGIVTYGVAARLLGLGELDRFVETIAQRFRRVFA